jgi:hypothetical protein
MGRRLSIWWGFDWDRAGEHHKIVGINVFFSCGEDKGAIFLRCDEKGCSDSIYQVSNIVRDVEDKFKESVRSKAVIKCVGEELCKRLGVIGFGGHCAVNQAQL